MQRHEVGWVVGNFASKLTSPLLPSFPNPAPLLLFSPSSLFPSMNARRSLPQSSKKFLQRVYSLASTVDSDCSRTAKGQCYSSTRLLQQRQVSKRLPTAGHPRNAPRIYVRVWLRLLQAAANADVEPFYHVGGSTRRFSYCMPPRALFYEGRRTHPGSALATRSFPDSFILPTLKQTTE